MDANREKESFRQTLLDSVHYAVHAEAARNKKSPKGVTRPPVNSVHAAHFGRGGTLSEFRSESRRDRNGFFAVGVRPFRHGRRRTRSLHEDSEEEKIQGKGPYTER